MQSNLDKRVREISELLRWHGGGVEIDEVTSDGVLRLRFTGMCTSCPVRPMTFAANIRPALFDLEGVTRVEVVGMRLSEEAEARLSVLASVSDCAPPIEESRCRE